MSNPSPQSGAWNIVLRRITDPIQQKKLGAKSFVIVGACALLSIVGFAIAISGLSPRGALLGVAGLLPVGIWVLIAVNSRTVSTWSGDDLIEILVADEGVIGQGGLAIAWHEISEVYYEWSKTVFRGSAVNRIGASAGGAALNAAGIDTTLKVIQIRVKDYKSIKARTTSKVQRLALFGPMLGDPGYLHVGQHGVTDESWRELLAVLGHQAERHGVPMNRKAAS